MAEHLYSLKEAADYLGIGENRLKELVRKRVVPAYKIGGTHLRFRQDQLSIAHSTINEPAREAIYFAKEIHQTGFEKVKDFFYFNDFYIISLILVIITVAAILTS